MEDVRKVQYGDVITLDYTGKLESGEVFDSTSENPIRIKFEKGQFIKGFEENILGMAVGEEKSFKVLPEDGYGNRVEELVLEVRKEDFPPNIPLREGVELELVGEDNSKKYWFIISEVKGDSVLLDGNHPLAGKTLFFDVVLRKIE